MAQPNSIVRIQDRRPGYMDNDILTTMDLTLAYIVDYYRCNYRINIKFRYKIAFHQWITKRFTAALPQFHSRGLDENKYR